MSQALSSCVSHVPGFKPLEDAGVNITTTTTLLNNPQLVAGCVNNWGGECLEFRGVFICIAGMGEYVWDGGFRL